MAQKLDLDPFRQALRSLEEALRLGAELAAEGEARRQLARDSAIHRFEFTYELAIRFLRRHLEETDSKAELDRVSYRDLIRLGAERGLLSDPRAWFDFREKRNLTVHTYNQRLAEAVYSILPAFKDQAQQLLTRLEEPS
ncbi:MAG TPA: HI0074 family nucleotidyltransferase substrate-binding subunit [Thermoanaerobaculia bacterium]|nr:HI0074 family nucleotidyltransferase substrate-binding subunit [Thermoanaerobaculia bacterium]